MPHKLNVVITIILASLFISTTVVAKSIISKKEIKIVEEGRGTMQQKSRYISKCYVEDQVCHYAMIEIWSKEESNLAIQNYISQVDDSKTPKMFKGTDMGRMMVENKALSICYYDAPCLDYLLEVVMEINKAPREMLELAYKEKSQLDKQSLQLQIHGRMKDQVVAVKSGGITANHSSSQVITAAITPGQVIDYERDLLTNNIVSLIVNDTGNQEINIKISGDDSRTAILAVVIGHAGKYFIKTVNGDTIEASNIELTYKGFLAREGSKFYAYSYEGNMTAYDFPIGFHPTQIQNANVFKTGYMLLERDLSPNNDATNSLRYLGSTIGLNSKEDYMLLDLHSGKTYSINLTLEGKKQTQLYNCRKKNDFINICDDAISRESLYKGMGFRNERHYYWAVRWHRTPDGAYLIALEDTGRNLTATDLENGDKRIIFHRTLGIAKFDTFQSEEGIVSISAKLGFGKKSIDNLASQFNKLEKISQRNN